MLPRFSGRNATSGPIATDWLGERPALLAALLTILVLLAIGVRAYKPDTAGVLVDRDYTSAIFARDFYFRHAEDVTPLRRDIARALRENQPDLEPPITEWIVSLEYRLAGRENLRLARVTTSLFWLAGGIYLFAVIRRLASTDAAFLGLGYYLLQPMSVLLARSFQPDALMMLMFLATLWATVRYHLDPSGRALLVAALLTAGTGVYRPLVLPALLGAFSAPQLRRYGLRKGILHRDSLAYVVIGIAPAFAYYGYASFVADYFGWKLSSSFRPYLLTHLEYWQGWLELAAIATSAPFLAAAAVGYFFLRRGIPRDVVVGLAVGYVVFCLLFTMHIHTHDYYHAQLIPLVALAGSPLAVVLMRRAFATDRRWPKALLVAVTCVIAIYWVRDIHRGLSRANFEDAETAREIGELVGHSDRVVFLSRYYGLPLQYLGEFTGAYWPRPITYWLYRTKNERELTIAERLAALNFEPEYFVITFFPEYRKNHADLAAYLEQSCVPKANDDRYLIYWNCRELDRGLAD